MLSLDEAFKQFLIKNNLEHEGFYITEKLFLAFKENYPTSGDVVDFEKAISNAKLTESTPEKVTIKNYVVFKSALSSFIACGEILDLYKKSIFYGTPLNLDKVKEAQDALLCHALAGVNLPKDKDMDYQLPEYFKTRTLHGLMGKMTETAELAELTEKYLSTGVLDTANLEEELGDDNFYDRIIIDDNNFTLKGILNKNNIKLTKKRYKKGVFSQEEAETRDLEAEREVFDK